MDLSICCIKCKCWSSLHNVELRYRGRLVGEYRIEWVIVNRLWQ